MTAILDAPTELLRLKKYQWDCRQPGCDGRPHQWMPYPHARADQIVGDERITAFVTGRGYGKTRAGSEWAKTRCLRNPGHRLAIISWDFGAAWSLTIEGESGLLAVTPPEYIAGKNRSLGEVRFTNGSMVKVYSAYTKDDAESIRGANAGSLLCEELGQWRHQKLAWDMAMLALRAKGVPTQVVVTTTPKPTVVIKDLLQRKDVRVVSGSTYDNRDNLDEAAMAEYERTYEGTRLGRQELYGQLLEDVVGALFDRDWFHPGYLSTEDMTRLVVAIDPAGSHKVGSDLTGIVVVGMKDDRLYVFEDLSGRYTPNEWATVAVQAYHRTEADLIIGEVNFGADMVQSTVRTVDRSVRFREVRASRGKQQRAEQLVPLYEQGRVFHVGPTSEVNGEIVHGSLTALEDQLCSWVPPGQGNDEDGNPIQASPWSPDRLDALVWAGHELILKNRAPQQVMRYQK